MSEMQPVAVAAVAMQQMQVTVPDGVKPGEQFQVNTPSGPMAVTCPSGVSSGDQMIVNLPAVAAPAAQAMARPQGASPQVDALVESLGGSVTIRMGTARYGTIAGYDGTYKVGSANKVAADLAVLDAYGKEALVLSFRSSSLLARQLDAKRTPHTLACSQNLCQSTQRRSGSSS